MPLFSVPGNCWLRAVGTVAASSTNVSSLSCSMPAGVQKGDFLVLCSTNCFAAPHDAITGWSSYTNMNNANDGTSGSQYVNLAVFTRVADGTEAASYNATVGTNTSGMTGVILALAGVDPDYVGNGGFRSGGTAVFGTGTSSTTTNAPAVIGGGVRSGELAVFVYGAGGGASGTYTSNIPFTAPGGAWATQANKASSVASAFNSGLGVFTQRGQAATPGTLTCSRSSKYVIAGATASVSVPNTPGQILTATGRAAFY